MQIMFIDDEEQFLATVKKVFSKMSITVTTFDNGKDGVQYLKNHEVDAIFIDVKMPGMDGFETLKKIKEISPIVEVILLTGHATVESASIGMRLGASDFLIKPVSMKTILRKAEEASLKISRYRKLLDKAD